MAGVTATAGCLNSSSSDDDGDGNGGNGDSPEDGGMEQIDSLDKTWEVHEDAYQGQRFEFESNGKIEYEGIVRSGPAVDFYVMEDKEVDHFESEERFKYITPASEPDSTSAEITADFSAGTYAIVVDNSEMGKAEPPADAKDNVAKVEVSFKMYS